MQNTKLDQLINQVENYLACLKHFIQFVSLGRAKKFSHEDDSQFLEVKSVLVQELELILAAVEVASPTKEEIHSVVSGAPSLRYLSEMSEGALRNLENQWHKIFIGWQAILGQLKVKQQAEEPQKGFFGRRKK